MADVLQFVVGTAVLWAPGWTLTWAFAKGLDWAKFLFISLIVGLSATTATVYVLNVFFGLPVTTFNFVLVSLAWASFGLAWALAARLDRSWN